MRWGQHGSKSAQSIDHGLAQDQDSGPNAR